MLISMMGAPGSGKGTIAQLLKKKGWIHYSMGQALREHVEKNGRFAKIIGKLNAKGILSPNRIVTPIFSDFFHKNKKKSIVLDGYPRNLGQVKSFDKVLREARVSMNAIILLDVPQSLLVNRLSGRRQCNVCGKIYGATIQPKKKGFCDLDGGKLVQRNDDKPSVIRHRFQVYSRETQPVIEWAAAHYPVFVVNGVGSPTVVFKRVMRIISLLK